MMVGACIAANGASVRLVVLDTEIEKPVPCRIHLQDANGKAIQGNDLPFWKDHFACPGQVEIGLTPGSYTYQIERGPEFLLCRGTFTVTADERQNITNRLHRLVDLAREGWWSGELHVHRPVADIELLMRAEDLHMAQVITWWNPRNPWTEQSLPRELLVRFDENRFYHVMAGEDERGGGALLYFNLPEPLKIAAAKREYPSPMKFLTAARQQKTVWVDVEKPFWWDAPVWLASGLVDSVGIANNHMQRSGMLDNEAWGKPRDRERFPGPHGNGLWTQEIYYHILNCGLRVPPSAGSASGVLPNPVGYNRLYVHVEGELTYAKWWDGVRAGHVFVSNGPLLRCRANGEVPGKIFQAASGQEIKLHMETALDSRDRVSEVQIIKNGQIERRIGITELQRTGGLGDVVFRESGWCLVRVIADVPETFRFASTGPFYVEIGATPRRISKVSAQFFLDWVRERMSLIKLADPQQQSDVLHYQRDAEHFWTERLAHANAE